MKTFLLVACVLLLAPLCLWAQVTVGRIEIQIDVELPSESARGQRGALVEVYDLVVEGYKDRFLTIGLQAVKESSQFMPYDYTMVLAFSEKYNLIISIREFDLGNSPLLSTNGSFVPMRTMPYWNGICPP